MSWFRIDDSFWGHPKRIACPSAAIGVWVTAGSWCAQQLTDGYVQTHVLPTLGGRPRDAADLVRAGLWEPLDDGWQFHDWHDYQPTRESVLRERYAARERQQRAREAAKSRRDSHRDSHQNHASSNGPPDPTRPVPKGAANAAPGRRLQTTIAATPTGNRLLEDHAAAYSGPVPRDVQRQTAERIESLLADGFTTAQITAGLAELRAKPKLGPGVLPNLVHEATSQAKPQVSDRGMEAWG